MQSFQAPGGEVQPGSEPRTTEPHVSPDERLALANLVNAKATPADDENALKSCPQCGAPWRKDARECSRCRYHISAGMRVHTHQHAPRFGYYVEQLLLLALVAGVAYGVYWLYNNAETLEKQGRKRFERPSRAPVEPEEKKAMIQQKDQPVNERKEE
jgi:hypothetical protein